MEIGIIEQRRSTHLKNLKCHEPWKPSITIIKAAITTMRKKRIFASLLMSNSSEPIFDLGFF